MIKTVMREDGGSGIRLPVKAGGSGGKGKKKGARKSDKRRLEKKKWPIDWMEPVANNRRREGMENGRGKKTPGGGGVS